MSKLPALFESVAHDTLAITAQNCATWKESFETSRANRIAKNAVTSAGILEAARIPEGVEKDAYGFSIDLIQGKRCNQEKSGRCWLFASLNLLRQRVIERYNLKTIEFSQTFAMFYDKLEKCNLLLLNLIDTVDEPIEGRLLSYLLDEPLDDGGQWDMFSSIALKYGVVPKEAMPETACSRNTSEMNRLLTRYMRACAMKLRRAHEEGKDTAHLMAMRERIMNKVYHFLVTCLGEPPQSFSCVIRDKDNKIVVEGEYTPQSFFENVIDLDIKPFVSCINSPAPNTPMERMYIVDRLGNVAEDGFVQHLNLPIEAIKAAAISQLKDGIPVWFGCDMSQGSYRNEGYISTDIYDFDDLFGFEIEASMNKAERLTYYETAMTHAMVLEGVKFNAQGNPVLWKVENSWGDDRGHDGFDIMNDKWFDENVFQVVVDRKYLDQALVARALQAEPILLPPWDPMGKLAQ